MKLELKNNKVFYESKGQKKEIHPFWLRERVNGEKFVDKSTQQRLFDPTQLQENIQIKNLSLCNDFLEVNFNDGASTKIAVIDIFKEFSSINEIKQIEKMKWDSSFSEQNTFEFDENLSETDEMYKALINFYQYGFVIFKNVPTNDNFIVKFANSIGSVRRTNFGEFFNVQSKPNPNDLAYTSLDLAPHTDNPYRNPVPCIQILQCIENEVTGGLSTLVDGYTVSEKLKQDLDLFAEKGRLIERSNMAGLQYDNYLNADLSDAILRTFPRVEGKIVKNPSVYMWVNRNPKGARNSRHTHITFTRNLLLSGVYYVKVPKDSGRIRFYDPRNISIMNPKLPKAAQSKCLSAVR